jgi:hypothetical protein
VWETKTARAAHPMNFDPFFAWLEQTELSIWVRESPSLLAFPTILVFHSVGMGFLVGTSMALDLRALGFPKQIPVASLEKFVPVAWFGFWINAISGILLLSAYPTKSLTNPVFYVKLICIAIAIVNLRILSRRMFRSSAWPGDSFSASTFSENTNSRNANFRNTRRIAVTSLVLWFLAVLTGRLLAYTYKRLMVNE